MVLTTEWITGYFAMRTFYRLGLHAFDEVDLFHSIDCNVTLISTVITRSSHHAVLLPLVQKLRAEYPQKRIELIADGLATELTLSNNKGRNDLADATTVIKLSWPHPSVHATLNAHFGDVDEHDLLVATLLADLGNQAIGRNQGFRFKGQEAIVLVDPKYFPLILKHRLMRYRLNEWSSSLPSFNRQLSKRAGVEAIRYVTQRSPLQGRLLELVANFDSFGRSVEARALAATLPASQRAKYDEWLASREDPAVLAAEDQKATARREKVKENVRRHRASKSPAG